MTDVVGAHPLLIELLGERLSESERPFFSGPFLPMRPIVLVPPLRAPQGALREALHATECSCKLLSDRLRHRRNPSYPSCPCIDQPM